MEFLNVLSRSEMKAIKGGRPGWCSGVAASMSIWHSECSALATSAGSWASADCHEDLAKTKFLVEKLC